MSPYKLLKESFSLFRCSSRLHSLSTVVGAAEHIVAIRTSMLDHSSKTLRNFVAFPWIAVLSQLGDGLAANREGGSRSIELDMLI